MNALDFLRANEYKGNGSFLRKAQYLKDNWDWLRLSYAIAIKVRHRMEDLEWTQKQLAKALNCTQQHVSILLKGEANMTLETISKLENALQFNLIREALAITDGYASQDNSTAFLNEASSLEDAFSGDTASLVDGYGTRKKKGPKQKQ